MLHNLQRACISGTTEFCEYEKQTSGIGHVWLKADLLNQISPGTDTNPVTQSGQCLILTNVPPLCGSCSEKTKPFIISFFIWDAMSWFLAFKPILWCFFYLTHCACKGSLIFQGVWSPLQMLRSPTDGTALELSCLKYLPHYVTYLHNARLLSYVLK